MKDAKEALGYMYQLHNWAMKCERHVHGKTFYNKSRFVRKYSERKSHVIQHQNKSCQFEKKKSIFFYLSLVSSFTKKYFKQLLVPEKSHQRKKPWKIHLYTYRFYFDNITQYFVRIVFACGNDTDMPRKKNQLWQIMWQSPFDRRKIGNMLICLYFLVYDTLSLN